MTRASAAGWAIPARLHVFVIFMVQFILLIALLGGVAPTLHSRGLSWAVLVPATALVLVLLHLAIGFVGALVPVRCRECRARSRYRGSGWWPFIYRYRCGSCGTELRIEVGG